MKLIINEAIMPNGFCNLVISYENFISSEVIFFNSFYIPDSVSPPSSSPVPSPLPLLLPTTIPPPF